MSLAPLTIYISSHPKSGRRGGPRGGRRGEEEGRDERDIPLCSRKPQVIPDTTLAGQDNGPETLRAWSLETIDILSPFKTVQTEGMMKRRIWNRKMAWTTHKPFSQSESLPLKIEEGTRSKGIQAVIRGQKKKKTGRALATPRGPLFPSHGD